MPNFKLAVPVLLLTLSAWADTFVVHPLIYKRVPRNTFKADLNAVAEAWPKLATKSAKTPVTNGQAALTSLDRKDCDFDSVCLSELAQKSKAKYAVYAQFDVREDQLLVSATVVREDAVVVDKSVSVQVSPAGGFDVAGVQALNMLLDRLKLSALPTSWVKYPVAQPAPLPKAPAVVPRETKEPVKAVEVPTRSAEPSLIAEAEKSSSKTAPTVLLVGGGVAAVAGTVLLVLGQSEIGALDERDGNINAIPQGFVDADGVARYVEGAQLKRTLGLVGLGLGAVAAITGGILFAKASGDAPAPVSFNVDVSSSGFATTVSGRF
jgi:hypothetical protein